MEEGKTIINAIEFVREAGIPEAQEEAVPNILEEVVSFKELMFRYSSAMSTLKTRLEILNEEFSVLKERTPIQSIKSRLKKPRSIAEKLMRKGLPLTCESIRDNLNDVAGVRVICAFIEDIYEVASMLGMQDDIEVLDVRDYIASPKENGYRSRPEAFAAGGGADPHHCHGFLGELRASAEIQKRDRERRRDLGGAESLRRSDHLSGRAHAEYPPQTDGGGGSAMKAPAPGLFFEMRKLHRLMGVAVLRLDFSQGEFELLGAVHFCEKNGAGISVLAEWMDVSLPAVSRTVRSLEEKGYVVREADSADRRNVTVRLTERGEKCFYEFDRAVTGFFQRVLARFTEAEKTALFDLNSRFAEGMREEMDKIKKEVL